MNNSDFFLHCLSSEHAKFQSVIEAVKEDQLDWKPEPKARSARDLIGHLIGHKQDLIELLEDGVIHHRNQVPFESLAEGLQLFDQAYETLTAKLAAVDEDGWSTPAGFYAGDHHVMTAPAANLAWLFLFDAIHHRGQLSTYLRPMGSKVPAIYGPSADTAH